MSTILKAKRICDSKVEDGIQYYQVKWELTWEPAEKLSHYQHLIEDFWDHINNCRYVGGTGPKPKKRKLNTDVTTTPTKGTEATIFGEQAGLPTMASMKFDKTTIFDDDFFQTSAVNNTHSDSSNVTPIKSSPGRGSGRGRGRGRRRGSVSTPPKAKVVDIQETNLPSIEKIRPNINKPATGGSPRGRGRGRGRGRAGDQSVVQDPSGNSLLKMSAYKSTIKSENDAKEDINNNEQAYMHCNYKNSLMEKVSKRGNITDERFWVIVEQWNNPHFRVAFVCRVCGKEMSFKLRNNWKRHADTHSDVKPFTCQICQKGFVQNIQLTKHMKCKHPVSYDCSL